MNFGKNFVIVFLFWSCVFTVGCLLFIDWFYTEHGGLLKVVALDVGQGSAIYINTPNNKEALVDTGPSIAVLRNLSDYRSFFDRSIDYLYISHIDTDHMSMAPRILGTYDVTHFAVTNDESESALYQATMHALLQGGTQVLIPEQGARTVVDTDLYIEYLWPHKNDVIGLNRNDSSLVLRVVYQNTSFLIMGDVSRKVERRLISQFGDALQSDVLFVGHHGSKTSSDDLFVSVVAPRYGVIQSGADNRYGHPHDITLQTLTDNKVTTLRNDLLGNIEFISDGVNLLVQ